MEYLTYFQTARRNPFQKRSPLIEFSSPLDEKGYCDTFITDDLITDLYLVFSTKSRQQESAEYCATRTGKFKHSALLMMADTPSFLAQSLSLDNTFKASAKATIVAKNGDRQNPMKGGVLSALNEFNENVSWVRLFFYL